MKIVIKVKKGMVSVYSSLPSEVVIVDMDDLSNGSYESVIDGINIEDSEPMEELFESLSGDGLKGDVRQRLIDLNIPSYTTDTHVAVYMYDIAVKNSDGNDVSLSVYEHENGGMFAVDTSFLEQVLGDDEDMIIGDPLNDPGATVELFDYRESGKHL